MKRLATFMLIAMTFLSGLFAADVYDDDLFAFVNGIIENYFVYKYND